MSGDGQTSLTLIGSLVVLISVKVHPEMARTSIPHVRFFIAF